MCLLMLGLYAAGWVATGPVGVILSTMSNAFETGHRVIQDLESGVVDATQSKPGSVYVLSLLRGKGELHWRNSQCLVEFGKPAKSVYKESPFGVVGWVVSPKKGVLGSKTSIYDLTLMKLCITIYVTEVNMCNKNDNICLALNKSFWKLIYSC